MSITRPLPDGLALRVARLCCGLSQGEIATRANVSPNRLFRIEKGTTQPTVDEIVRMLGALSTSTDPPAAAAQAKDPERSQADAQ
jgi:transcriptional regulator with XRE-family HTH domain